MKSVILVLSGGQSYEVDGDYDEVREWLWQREHYPVRQFTETGIATVVTVRATCVASIRPWRGHDVGL